MTSFGGRPKITLSNGVELSTGRYFVQLGETRVDLPYPSAGYGGSELVISSDERTVAMFVYSGQSQVGYELFRIDAKKGSIERISGMPYEVGEGDAPVFSPDGRWLAMLASAGPYERDTGEYIEDLLDPQADEGDEIVADLAQLFIQAIPDIGRPSTIQRHFVGATIRKNADYDAIASWNVYDALSFSPEGRLVLAPTWATRVELDMPIAGEITLEPLDAAYAGIP